MNFPRFHLYSVYLVCLALWLAACSPSTIPSAQLESADFAKLSESIPPGFAIADGPRTLTFPADFGVHPDFRTEWWYYTGNLDTPDGRHFGFELTFFRVGLLPPSVDLPSDSQWYDRNLFFAHFAISDIASERFYAFERYSRPGPGLAGAQAVPYSVWLEDWNVSEQGPGLYRLQAAQEGITLELTLRDEMGVVLHGQEGYSRKGEEISNASYYYSQPRLHADGFIQVTDTRYPVSGLAWKDHEYSTSLLDENQIGWDWFSLQFEDGSALMLFQLRHHDGETSASTSGTFIPESGDIRHLQKTDFSIVVLENWSSPHTQGLYPAAWEIRLHEIGCTLEVSPWMADQEINFPAVTYWEGAVHFEGTCNGRPAQGNGYVELTGYAGDLPLR